MEVPVASPSKVQAQIHNAFKSSRLSFMFSPPPLGFKEEGSGIIKPKPIHPNAKFSQNRDTKDSEPRDEVQETDSKPQVVSKDDDDAEKYVVIDSVYPNGGKIKVLACHLKRIMKRREDRKKLSKDETPIPIIRPKHDGPMHDSRSKFAKKRLRGTNGRFRTKEEIEEERQQDYKDSILEFLRYHNIPAARAR